MLLQCDLMALLSIATITHNKNHRGILRQQLNTWSLLSLPLFFATIFVFFLYLLSPFGKEQGQFLWVHFVSFFIPFNTNGSRPLASLLLGDLNTFTSIIPTLLLVNPVLCL